MIGSERIIALIPARGGSKGIPRKNLADLGGHPLLAWSVACAQRCSFIDRVIMSTEDEEIADTGREYGAEVYPREQTLASDTAGVFEVTQDLLHRLKHEGETARILVVLEPTAPFRTVEMIEDCVRPVAERNADSATTFRPCRTHPFRAWYIEDSQPKVFVDGATPWKRRQDLPDAWQISGEVYAFDTTLLDPGTRAFLHGRMRAIRVHDIYDIDVDTPADLWLARQMFGDSHLAKWALTKDL